MQNESSEMLAMRYCLRTVIYEHLSRARIKLQARAQVKPVDSRPRSVTTRNNSTISLTDILTSATYTSKDKKKFPKELIKSLEVAIKKVVMRQNPLYDEVQLRGTFGAFYAYYVSDAFQKTMKDNRKIEDLILMFYSRATGELQKRIIDTDLQPIVLNHVTKFVRLLLDVVKSQRLASDDSDLVYRLTEYESKLTKNEEYSLTSAKSDELSKSNARPETTTIDINLSTSPVLKKLQRIFNVPERVMQDMIDSTRISCTEEAVVQDLKLLLKNVQTDAGSAYTAREFASEHDYQTWKARELDHLTSTILKLASHNPLLAKGSTLERSLGNETDIEARKADTAVSTEELKRLSIRNSTGSSQYTGSSRTEVMFYVPSRPLECFDKLIELCITQDRMEAGASHASETSSLLSSESLEILQYCKSRWRITETEQKVLYLQHCSNAFVNGEITLEELDLAFMESKEGEFLAPSELTIMLEKRYKDTLLILNDSLFRDLYTEVQKIFNGKIDTQAITFLDEHIYSDPRFSTFAQTTARMFDELETGLLEVAELRYRDLRDEICSPSHLEILHIVKLADELVKQIEILRKRYRTPLLGVLNIWNIFSKVSLMQFLHDVKPLLEQCYRNVKSQNMEFAIEDMFTLYRSVTQVSDMLRVNLPEFQSPINVDLYFRPFLLKWLQQAHTSIVALVSRVLAADRFQLDESSSSTGNCHSESIVLLFKCFSQHLTYLRALEWPDEYWNAKFVTSLTHTFSSALKEYSLTIQQMFIQECLTTSSEMLTPSSQPVSLQQRLILKARDAMNKKENIEPFRISQEACIKLNNVEWAKLQLDSLEHEVNSESLAEIISRSEGPRKPWSHGQNTHFSVKVVSAENLIPCDSNGYSDPYVVLSDQKGRRIGKTRTIFTNLNPRWDESFDMTTSESLWLAATVWDRDAKGEHDICGRAYFRLDPRYFEDLVPKEFPLELDTQGILNLRITMEVEMDESSFHFARAFRFIHRAEDTMCRAIVDKMTPFISTALSRHTLKHIGPKTSTLDGTIGSAYQLLNKAGFAHTRLPGASRDRNSQLTNQDFEAPIEPLMQYLDDNFRTLDTCLTRSAFSRVMVKLWTYVVTAVENVIVPQLSAKGEKSRRPLAEDELDVCYRWLGFLKDTFAGDGGGLTEEELQTPQYQDLLSIRFFYFDDTEELMHECDRMIALTTIKSKAVQSRTTVRRRPCNLGTIRKIQEEKRATRRELANSEEIILRVLRQRPEQRAQLFVSTRLKEKHRSASRAVQEAGMVRSKVSPSSALL